MALKNKQWHAGFYETYQDFIPHVKETAIRTDSLAQLWNSLMDNNVLTLPNAADLRDSTGEVPVPNVRDGTVYTIELIKKDSKRQYSYHCPASLLNEYPYIPAFKNFVAIIRFICKYCGIPDYRIC